LGGRLADHGLGAGDPRRPPAIDPSDLHKDPPMLRPLPAPKRPSRPTLRRGSRGLTLIELMVAVAIVAILAGIAYPNYRDYVQRGHLAEASNGLATLRAQMERHFQDNRSYATVGSFTTPCAAAAPTRTFGNFVISCVGTPTDTAFTLAATGSGPVSGFTFTINQNDVRATTAAPSGWPTCATKWMLKKGITC
jgi:type IV pilus assembly protein PilE